MENESVPTVPEAAFNFVHSQDAYPENPHYPLHERWAMVLTECPFARGRAIHEDFDDDLQRVYNTGTYNEVWGASELVLLQWRFYSLVYTAGIGMRHIAHYEVHASWVWMRKLTDKLSQMTDNKKRAPKEAKEPLRHSWLN